MPPGRIWPKRLRGRLFSRRHRITVSFGEPIQPGSDTNALVERVQTFFDSTTSGGPSLNPYRRRDSGKGSKPNGTISNIVANGTGSNGNGDYSSSSSSQSVVRATALRHLR
jgi:hypothetical protein